MSHINPTITSVIGASGRLYSSITAVKFSPVCPLVFAAASAEGYVFFFNLHQSTTGPVSSVSIPLSSGLSPNGKNRNSRAGDIASSSHSGITGIAFNSRQRDKFAACDSSGKIHIWKLDWILSNPSGGDQALLDQLGSIQIDLSNKNP